MSHDWRASAVRIISAATGILLVATMVSPADAVPAPQDATPSASTRSAPHPPQLRRSGRWLVDRSGRVVLIHGFNLVWKTKPYVPPNSPEGFTEADARWLRSHGFNGVRLGTLWAGITPTSAGVADDSYRTRWERVMTLLARQKIWMQLDAHQDQWNEYYGGEGVPDWAVIRPDGFSAAPPVNAPFPMGYWTPETSTVYDNFWANKDGLLDAWIASWRIAASWWKDLPYSMGYDLINEPWVGLEWETCFVDGCPTPYSAELQPAYVKATSAIRKIDPHNLIWWEPQQLAGGQQEQTYLTAGNDPQLGYAWHNYCQDVFLQSQGVPGANVENCWAFSRNREQTAIDQAATLGAAPLMNEWGATDDVRATKIDGDVADEFIMGWMIWAYKRWNDPTTADTAQGLFDNDADLSSVKQGKLHVLERTYPQATAGTPMSLKFDTDTGAFDYRYRPNHAIQRPTRVFISSIHYPHGYQLKVSGAKVVKRTKRYVFLRARRSASEVRVTITGR